MYNDKQKRTLYTLVLSTWFLGNMGIHLISPTLPQISQHFGSSVSLSQMVISLFLLGKSLGMLLWGPLSERYGRRPFMLVGLSLYVFASSCSVMTNDPYVLLLLRFLQGIGVSATLLMGRSIINDRYKDKQAVKAFAFLFTIAGIIIAFLPVIGGYLASLGHWQYPYLMMAAYASVILIIMYLKLDETHTKKRQKINIKSIFSDYQRVFVHPLFLGYLFCSAFMVAGESAFNTSASFILIKQLGFSTKAYGWIKTALGCAHLLGCYCCAKVIKRYDIHQLVGIGVSTFALSSLLMIFLAIGQLAPLFALVLPMLFYYFGTGFIVATTSAAIVKPFPDNIATALAFSLFLQFIISFLFSFITSILGVEHTLPLAELIFIVSLLAFGTWALVIYPREKRASSVSQ